MQSARYVLCGVYAVIALAALIRNRRHILPAFAAPFRRTPTAGAVAEESEPQATTSAIR